MRNTQKCAETHTASPVKNASQEGVKIPTYHFFKPSEAKELTHFLHQAYKEYANTGFNIQALDQDEQTTLQRSTEGPTIIGRIGGTIVTSMSMTIPPDSTVLGLCSWATSRDMWLGQVAVDAQSRRMGFASQMWKIALKYAQEQGIKHIGLHFAEAEESPAEVYTSWGFYYTQTVRFPPRNYNSIIMRYDV